MYNEHVITYFLVQFAWTQNYLNEDSSGILQQLIADEFIKLGLI